MSARIATALILAASGGALSACGSSDSGGSSTLDRSALAEKADEICAASPQVNEQPKNLQEAIAVIRTEAKVRAKLYADLAALKPDSATKQQWDAVLAEFEQANAYVPRLLAAAEAQDGSLYRQLLPQWIAANNRASASASRFGTKNC